MTISNGVGAFNLKAVVQQTGLKPDTLRAWERRYGLPNPKRTKGGHRVYSKQDVKILKWLLARQDEGLSISRAVKLWNSLESEGEDPLDRASTELRAVRDTYAETAVPLGDNIAAIRESWKAACIDFNERQAENLLTQAFSYYPVEVVCLEILQKGLAEIGTGWYQGKITVQQEHFASALAIRRLDALLAGMPLPSRPQRIIVACAPEDDHTFSILLLTVLLRRQGWDVVYLGRNVPAERMENTIRQTEPDLMILSAQLLHTAANLVKVAKIAETQGITFAYGGMIFNQIPQLRERIPGHFLGKSLDEALYAVAALIEAPRPTPKIVTISADYTQASAHFQDHAAAVEAEVWSLIQQTETDPQSISTAVAAMTQSISAALALGDLSFIGIDIRWVEGLMVNYRIPINQLKQFIRQYNLALHKQLDPTLGKVILEWFAAMIVTIEYPILN